ncbi:MAG: spermidine/putrescine ABC transporter ATP-binding protein [Phototrophicales bacterium]|nr:MAG: spermidine/putrescine ABC transporter ATP-binding protein [Phototrophicales bacterium]RMG75204.1 MAG: ABC transporter ATP-binding protein [Chloroflexota bacterium]
MLELHAITRQFDGVFVLQGVNLTIMPGEILCLLGASGCGKTTLLRIIAGLESCNSGDIWLDGVSVKLTPPHQRGVGLMFQDFALFPHMNVLDNVAFGLKMQRVPRAEREARAREILAVVGLSGFEKRDVSQLSGGEKQRVALARSLAPNPRLLMLDEPLGSLDAALRERLVVELRDIIQRLGLTAIYVTHDQQEAFAIADRVAVMNVGKIEQVANPQELYQQPKTVFVAQFLGMNNIVPASWVARYLNHRVQTPFVLLHPDHIKLGGDLTGEVVERVFLGGAYRLKVRVADDVMLTLRADKPYQTVNLSLDIAGLIPLES